MKTLDGNLLMVKDGERITVSSRVAELGNIVPQFLGVPTAILDNVIFCHQDDSLWPMSEPSALKKKFDEIFEAMKYTKAIDNLKTLRKTQHQELAKFKIFEDQYKTDKDKGERLQVRSEALSKEVDQLRAQHDSLNRDMKILSEEAKEKHTRKAEAAGLVNQLQNKQEKADWLQASVENLKLTLDELGESDEWLQSTLAQRTNATVSRTAGGLFIPVSRIATDRGRFTQANVRAAN